MPNDVRQNTALLSVEDLEVAFRLGPGQRLEAVAGISLAIAPGEALGLVGESGCGKTTVARTIVGLQRPAAGRIFYEGRNLAPLSAAQRRALQPQIQMIFQDATAALNPGRSVGRSVAEPLRRVAGLCRAARRERACEMLCAVGLDPQEVFDLRPHEFSVGQCQRIGIARALILNPRLLVCDEPVSSLDVSVQAQILNLLIGLQRRRQLAMLFISHDLAVVKNVCDRVAVMYLGRLCETAGSQSLFSTPRHPYTATLLAAIPVPDPNAPLAGNHLASDEIPSPVRPPSGCRFHPRCYRATDRCALATPPMRPAGDGRQVACHHPL